MKIARLFRLWGKKRGQRMSGWWFVGSLGEAAFFGSLFVIGLVSLSALIAWPFLSPETQVFRVGYGYWVMVLASASLAAIGGAGFTYRVLRVAISDEHRTALANRAKGLNTRPSGTSQSLPSVPTLQGLTDSPGIKLAYRLPGTRPEVGPLILSSIFVLAWTGMTAIWFALALGAPWRDGSSWTLYLLLPFFVAVAFYSARWFFRNFRRAAGIGLTTIEISDLPLYAGGNYSLHLAQYGRLAIRKLKIALVCEELSTYHHGTDVRTEHHTVFSQLLLEQGRHRIDFGKPMELECTFRVPPDAMHSFHSEHNAVVWKIVVEGDANRWPSYFRSFPVVVYPAASKRPTTASPPS